MSALLDGAEVNDRIRLPLTRISIALAQAVTCADCPTVWELKHGEPEACPRCTSTTFEMLTRVRPTKEGT